MYTLSQLRRQIDALQIKYAKELAIYRLRPITEQISNDWARAVADRQPVPEPHTFVRRISNAGFLLPTYASLHQYLERIRREGRLPEPRQILLALLPWAGADRYSDLFALDLPAEAYETGPGPGAGNNPPGPAVWNAGLLGANRAIAS